MIFYHHFYVFLIVASAGISAGISILSWRNREVPGSLQLAGLMLAITIWAAAKVLELTRPGLPATVFWANAQYVGIVVVPAAWLLFALVYTGSDDRATRRVIGGLAVEPVVAHLLIWTNETTGLFRTSVELVPYGSFTVIDSTAGPAFWLHTVYAYLLLSVGTWLILRMVILSDHLYRGQAIGLLVAVLAPWFGNGLFLVGIVPPGLDPTIIAFTITGVILVVVIHRHRLLETVPVAREVARTRLIESMTDAVIVVDDRDRLVDCNPAARAVLDIEIPDAIGQPLADVSPRVTDVLVPEATEGRETFQTELELREDDAFHCYDVRVTTLQRGFGVLTGRLISLRDVTDQRQREQRLDVLNRLLRHNLRNELNVVRGNASLLREAVADTDARRRIDTIRTAVDTLIERSEKISSLANRSEVAAPEPIDIGNEIDEFVAVKRREYPDVTFSVEQSPRARVDASPAVVTVLDELLTNAIKHNDAETPVVKLRITTDRRADGDVVRIRISDNGPGIPDLEVDPIRRGEETPLDHATGVGLWLVTWTVREIDGEIEFTETDDGTTITITLPRTSDTAEEG